MIDHQKSSQGYAYFGDTTFREVRVIGSSQGLLQLSSGLVEFTSILNTITVHCNFSEKAYLALCVFFCII